MTESELYPKPLFSLIEPKANSVPMILHLPHTATFIPKSISSRLVPEKREELDDTDWFLDQLYDFCSGMGVLMVKANYHRWVADLNRDPVNTPLYDDGRIITTVIPEIDFNGEKLYHSSLTDQEISQRIADYHQRYFIEFKLLMKDYLQKFGKLLIWDGHSIRRLVPGIQKQPFPDLILGTNNRSTCPQAWHQSMRSILDDSKFNCTYDTPFRGGYITRSLADRELNVFTVQMEMCKDLYMDASERKYDDEKSQEAKALFKNLFLTLINHLCQD